jgi:hypothetical protein
MAAAAHLNGHLRPLENGSCRYTSATLIQGGPPVRVGSEEAVEHVCAAQVACALGIVLEHFTR